MIKGLYVVQLILMIEVYGVQVTVKLLFVFSKIKKAIIIYLI